MPAASRAFYMDLDVKRREFKRRNDLVGVVDAQSESGFQPAASSLDELAVTEIVARRPSPLEKCRRRANLNLEAGWLLGDIAELRCDFRAEVTADLLKLSGYDKAIGELTNLIDQKGRVYSCPKSLVSASSLLDTNYQIKAATRHRKRIFEAFTDRLSEIKQHNLDVSFLTATYPNLRGVGFNLNDRFQSRAWELFLQMKVFGEFFYAGFSKTEWTLGNRSERAKTGREFDLLKDGINYHLHALCINFNPFAAGETSALENELEFLQKEKRNDADSKKRKILIRNSLKIVSAWTQCLKKAHLEIFGKSLEVKTKSGRVRFTFQDVSTDEIKAFDFDATKNGIFWEIAKTASYTAKANSFKGLTPDLLLEAENVFKRKRMLNPFGVFRKQVKKTAATLPSLVKELTKQSEKCSKSTPNLLFDSVLRGENEPLKTYGIRLCLSGLRETWLNYLEVNKDLIISRRRDALLEQFPSSIFTDLTGKSYYGWQAIRLLKQKEKEAKAGYNPESDDYYIFKKYQERYFSLIASD
jgi:hypothetical protein